VSKHLLMLMLAVVALNAAGCATPPVTPVKTEVLTARSFARQWATDLQDGASNPVTAVHVADKYVFVYREDGSSSVIDKASGRLMQIDHPKGGSVRMHAPVILKDRIVYPTTTHLEVFEVGGHYIPHPLRSTDEGDKPFSQELSFPIRSDAVGSGKLVFFGADFRSSGRAVAVDMTRAYVPDVWTLMTPGSFVSSAPALSKEAVFFASERGNVAAVSIEDRKPLWTLPEGVFGTYGGVVANLMLDASGLYVASTDTKLYCLMEKSGRVKWQFFAGEALKTPPALTKDLVYQYIPGKGLAAIDKNAGSDANNSRSPRWIATDAVKFLSADDTYAYAATRDNHIAALEKATGQERYRSRRHDFKAFAVNASGDGMIYLSDENARVIAVRPILQSGSTGEVVLQPVPVQPLAVAR
jgi:hypothetical protein